MQGAAPSTGIRQQSLGWGCVCTWCYLDYSSLGTQREKNSQKSSDVLNFSLFTMGSMRHRWKVWSSHVSQIAMESWSHRREEKKVREEMRASWIAACLVGGKVETVVNQGSQILAQGSKDLEDRMFTDDSGKEYLVFELLHSQGLLGTIKAWIWPHVG